MKKIIVLFSFIILLTGCNKSVDVGEYLSIEYNQPVLNRDLTIDEPSMQLVIDRNSLKRDFPQVNLEGNDKEILQEFGILVNGNSLDTSNLEISDFNITINTQLEDGTKVIVNKVIKETDEDIKEKKYEYEKQLSKLEEEREIFKNMEPYVEAAEDNLQMFNSANIDFYVSESKFNDAYDFFEMKTPLFECDDKVQTYLDNNSIYYIAEKANNDQTYYSLFDDNFNQTDIVLFNGILMTNYAYTTASGSSKVVETPVEVPMIYAKNFSSQNDNLLYNTETKSKFASSEKMSQVIDDYETVFESTIELKSKEPNFVDQRLMDYIDQEYIYSNGQGYNETRTLESNPNMVEVSEWVEASLAPKQLTDYSYQAFSAQTYGIFFNHYNVSVKLAHGYFD